jgi:Fe2+ transport system protein FeoA/Mn-dependent DtxR family transcriptional regulator
MSVKNLEPSEGERLSKKGDALDCALEVIMTLERRGLHPDDMSIAEELGKPLVEVQKMMEEAIREGLVVKKEGHYELTAEGLKRVLRHRELFVHDRFVHGEDRWSTKVRDWGKHWRHRHGLTKDLLESFYKALADLDGRVEELKPLSDMEPSERGIVVSIACGLGVARRLAEMGLTPGVQVAVIRKAPLRGPVEVEVRGTRVVLGYGLALRIAVKGLGGLA